MGKKKPDLKKPNAKGPNIKKLDIKAPDIKKIDLTSAKTSFQRLDFKSLIKEQKNFLLRILIGFIIFIIGFILYKTIKKTIWVGLPFLIIAYFILGYDVILKAAGKIAHKQFLDEHFLMSISTIGAFIVGEYPEAVIVMLLYQIGEFLTESAIERSTKDIAKLLDIRPSIARVRRFEDVNVHPSDVHVGETIVVYPGEKIPLDGVILSGESLIDTSRMTGESVPRRVFEGAEVLAGFICKDGTITIRVTRAYDDTTAAKIVRLVKEAEKKKAPAEQFITKFSRYYTPIVCAIALLIAIIPSIITKDPETWVYRALVFLVISCPCALVISVPLTFFGGLGKASSHGILIKGSNYLESLTALDTIVFDKTGTLTKGNFAVTQVSAANGFKEQQLLSIVAYAECQSNHPIAKSIMHLYYETGGKHIEKSKIREYKEIPGHGVSVVAGKHLILAGNTKLMRAANISFTESAVLGTKVYVAADGEFVGYIVISDEIKDDARDAILGLKNLGIEHTAMLTGDNSHIASSIAKSVGIEKYYAELLPDEKVEAFEELLRMGNVAGTVAFVGDGTNDAPTLARADIGIAMGGIGSDAAIEAADVVIMTDEPSKIADAVSIALETKKIVSQNIVAALAVKALLLILGIVGVASMWFAVFGDVGVMILAVINSLRILKK